MQRYNFQFTGQRFYRIEHGRLAGSCATSPTRPRPPTSGARWPGSAARRPTSSAARSTAARASPARSPRSATAARRQLFRQVRMLNTNEEGRQHERRCAARARRARAGGRRPAPLRRPGRGGEPANLRWAANTLTTNGVASGQHGDRHRRRRAAPRVSSGVVRRGGVQRGRHRRRWSPRRRPTPRRRRRPRTPARWSPGGPTTTSARRRPSSRSGPGVLRQALGAAIGQAFAARRRPELFGYAEQTAAHDLPGLDDRAAGAATCSPPAPGRAQRQVARPHPLGLGRAGAPRAGRRRRARAGRRGRHPAGLAGPAARARTPAATTRCCRRARSPT